MKNRPINCEIARNIDLSKAWRSLNFIRLSNRLYALTSSRRHVGGQSHDRFVRAFAYDLRPRATGTFLTTARNPIDPQARAP